MGKTTRSYIDKLLEEREQSLRRMVSEGELLPAPQFAKRLGISLRALAQVEGSGGVFSIAFDETSYYPALLASSLYDKRRLRKLCRIIFPAPESARWKFLITNWSSLGDISPVEAMQTEAGYRMLLKVARAWATQWWRTTVEIYDGSGVESDTPVVAPVCTGTVEEDPRVSVWRRASAALDGANTRPNGPYPQLAAATVVITKDAGVKSERVLELRLHVTVSGCTSHVDMLAGDAVSNRLGSIPTDEADDIVTVVRQHLAAVAKSLPRRRHTVARSHRQFRV